MATKKQKREQALAKRAKFEAEEKARGLQAQKNDRERRAKQSHEITLEEFYAEMERKSSENLKNLIAAGVVKM